MGYKMIVEKDGELFTKQMDDVGEKAKQLLEKSCARDLLKLYGEAFGIKDCEWCGVHKCYTSISNGLEYLPSAKIFVEIIAESDDTLIKFRFFLYYSELQGFEVIQKPNSHFMKIYDLRKNDDEQIY